MISQPLSSLDQDALCWRYLNLIYQDMHDHSFKKNLSETNGEILYASINKLLSLIPLTKEDVFFDLGAGVGKIVLQVFLKTAVKEAAGIELLPELHEKAIIAVQKIQRDLPEFYADNRKLTMIQGSFLDVPFSNATVVLVGATCFPPSLLNALGKIIDKTPSIHT